MSTEDFNNIREKYITARDEQRNTIVSLLKANGYIVITGGTAGSGR